MANIIGTNIKQLTTRSNPALTDFLYLVAGDEDYNVRLSAIRAFFGIDDIEDWQTKALNHSSDNYINTVDSTEFGVVKIEYLAKRGSRTYHSGIVTAIYNTSGVLVSDFWENSDPDGLGLTISGQLSGGLIQIILTVDSSDTNDITFNYRITSKKPITVS